MENFDAMHFMVCKRQFLGVKHPGAVTRISQR